MDTILCFDIEADGFEPSEIFVLGVTDFHTGEFTAYTSEAGNVAEGLIRLTEADMLICHYGLGYDIPQIERLTDGLITIDRSKVVDTCALSMRLFPNLVNHKLRTWGDILGFPKGSWDDFTKFDPGMVPYCQIDCAVTRFAATFMFELLAAEEPARKAA